MIRTDLLRRHKTSGRCFRGEITQPARTNPLTPFLRLCQTSGQPVMTFRRLSCGSSVQKTFILLSLTASALTAIGQNPTATGLMINGPDSLRGRTATAGTYVTAPGTGAIALNVFAERNGTRVDRQALLKLVDRTTQKALWATTDDRAQGVFTNISYGTYDMEVSAVGFFSARKEVLMSPASSQMEIDIVLQRDPAAVSLDVSANTYRPKLAKRPSMPSRRLSPAT